MSATGHTLGTLRLVCINCAHDCEAAAKFCSNCGTIIDHRLIGQFAASHGSGESLTVPEFAPVAPRHIRTPNNELRGEAAKLMLLLARERLFLYTHWLVFLGLNLFGVWMAMKCYSEYLGDDMTRLMMGSTPLLYINCCSLLCIVPIRGTKKEIARLKEKLNYTKFQIEYDHLL